VAAALEGMGHRALAIDLPGLGDDPAPPEKVTLDDYTARVEQALESCTSPAVLAGHSMGGIVISAAAERRPELIHRLVYIAALVPADGQSLTDIEAGNPDPRVPQAMVRSPDGKLFTLVPGCARELFYHDCPPDVAAWAESRLRPQSMAPVVTRVRLSPERYGRVPRTYIECTEDGAVCIALQRRMQKTWPGTEVLSLPTSHSPFLSAPSELAAMMSQAAGT
jgi:pimeloyl-ACP methyl ester carboxylesterase